MTRDTVKAIMPEATEEQITEFLNKTNSELAKEKQKSQQLKEKAEKADELQKQIEQFENEGKSELEKAQERIAELERNAALSASRTVAMEKLGMNAEQAALYVKNDGTFDTDVLAQFITDQKAKAAQQKMLEIANNSQNPNGGTAVGQEDKQTEAEKIAQNLGKNTANANATAKSVIDNYL